MVCRDFTIFVLDSLDNLKLGATDKICLHLCPGLNFAVKFTKSTIFWDGLAKTAKFATGQNQLNKQKCVFLVNH